MNRRGGEPLDRPEPVNRDLLRQYLDFYRDLGIQELYLREPATTRIEANSEKPMQEFDAPPPAPPSEEEQTLPGMLPRLEPENDTLAAIRADIGDCTRCGLHKERTNIVFGVGNEKAKLVFVGEGPGADEDAQGIPFVGRAGKLLTQMIENTAAKDGIPLKREDVYICNVVKCRPPGNRTPEPDEMEVCGQFLFRQLSVIRPKAICALGGTASRALLGKREGVTKLRGQWHRWRDIPVLVTYHPSYLLRPYNKDAKRHAWEDLRKLFHYVYD